VADSIDEAKAAFRAAPHGMRRRGTCRKAAWQPALSKPLGSIGGFAGNHIPVTFLAPDNTSNLGGRPMRTLTVLALALLGGSAAQPLKFARIDGQTMIGNPQLAQQFDTDQTICQGELAKADAGSRAPASDMDVYRGCMASRGYREVTE
jgi:hypothetical protein